MKIKDCKKGMRIYEPEYPKKVYTINRVWKYTIWVETPSGAYYPNVNPNTFIECEHKSTEIKFVQVISATPYEVVALFQETCNKCGELIGDSEYISFYPN